MKHKFNFQLGNRIVVIKYNDKNHKFKITVYDESYVEYEQYSTKLISDLFDYFDSDYLLLQLEYSLSAIFLRRIKGITNPAFEFVLFSDQVEPINVSPSFSVILDSLCKIE